MARIPKTKTDQGRRDSLERIAALGAAVGKSKLLRPAAEVMKRVRAVRTIFPAIDWKLRVGGWPLERIATIHGPSGQGKTKLTHGLGYSFLKRGHYYLNIDAERTTPITWMESLIGECAHFPTFLAMRPNTYEEAVAGVREFAELVHAAREKKKIPADTTGIIVVDSLRALVPKDFFDKVAKEDPTASKKAGVDAYGGRGPMIKAKLNTAWVDELTPLLDDKMLTLVFIAREYENTSTDPWAPEYNVGGGQGVYFGSSLFGRVRRQWVRMGKGEDARVVGERHACTFRKTKVAGMEERTFEAYFHTSNGAITPAGFDLARDLVEVGTEIGVVKSLDDGWLSWNRKRFHGAHQMVKKIAVDSSMLAELEEVCRAKFEREGGDVVDADGRVQT